jgi:hypothetical protein
MYHYYHGTSGKSSSGIKFEIPNYLLKGYDRRLIKK